MGIGGFAGYVEFFDRCASESSLIKLGFEWFVDGDGNRTATVEVRFRKVRRNRMKAGSPAPAAARRRNLQMRSFNETEMETGENGFELVEGLRRRLQIREPFSIADDGDLHFAQARKSGVAVTSAFLKSFVTLPFRGVNFLRLLFPSGWIVNHPLPFPLFKTGFLQRFLQGAFLQSDVDRIEVNVVVIVVCESFAEVVRTNGELALPNGSRLHIPALWNCESDMTRVVDEQLRLLLQNRGYEYQNQLHQSPNHV
jgi:hypothetical protein